MEKYGKCSLVPQLIDQPVGEEYLYTQRSYRIVEPSLLLLRSKNVNSAKGSIIVEVNRPTMISWAQCPQILLCSPGSGTAGESEEGVDLLGTVPMFPDLVSNGRWDIFNLPPEISDWTHIYNIIEGSLEVKLSTIWTDEKQSREDAERRERLEERRRVRRKKMQMREKVGKSRNTVFFQWFGAPEGRKVGSLKRRVRSQLARWEMKNCTPLWREAHFQVKMYITHQVRTTFGSWDVEKVHAVVARSTFPSQNAQNTPGADHFWQLRCRKSARRCDAKHIS